MAVAAGRVAVALTVAAAIRPQCSSLLLIIFIYIWFGEWFRSFKQISLQPNVFLVFEMKEMKRSYFIYLQN